MTRPSSRVTGRVIAGVALVSAGLLFLLDNYEVLDIGDIFRFWPVILIGAGLVRLLWPGRPEERGAGVVLVTVGSVFLLPALDLPGFRLRQIWPALLVLSGGALIWQALLGRRHPKPDLPSDPGERTLDRVRAGLDATKDLRGEPTEAGVLNEFALMGGGDRVVRSQAFRGGDVTAILGGFEIDLRGAAMAGDSATIEVFTLFGGVEFKVPPEWSVVLNGMPVLGVFSNSTKAARDGSAPAKTLILKGAAIMGGVEVTN
jgi:hypothetical protein